MASSTDIKPGTAAVKEREQMYRLIISQLFYDGYQQIAVNLSQAVSAYPSCPPSEKLLHICKSAFALDHDMQKAIDDSIAPAQAIDLEFESDVIVTTPEPALYEAVYVSTHKGACRALAISADGTLVATGSVDASIKIIDMERVIQRSQLSAETIALAEGSQQAEIHPVIRTLYDHIDEIKCLAFHPREQILASGSMDFSLKFFDYAKSSVKRAFKTITEVEPPRALAFHPVAGEYIVVGTYHPTLRLYCVETSRAFVSSIPGDQHRAPITDVNYAEFGRMYCSASKDGDIKIWDGVSGRCVSTIARAHDGVEVCSARFSKNSKYILSSGKDSLVKLWELAANRCLIAYTGAGLTGKQEHRVQATFNHAEDYVLFPDEKSGSLCAWDARNADRKRLLPLTHTAPVRAFAHSPVQPAFVTCSEDFRARFWVRKPADLD